MNPEDLNVEEAEKEVEENPCNIKVLSDLGQHYANRGDYLSAIRNYDKILRVSEDNPRAWVALGHCYLLKKDFIKSINAYQKALQFKEESNSAELWYGLGLLYFFFDEWKYANKVFLAILEYKKGFFCAPDIHYKVAIGLIKEKKYSLAVEHLEMALDLPDISEKLRQDLFVGLCEAWVGMDNEEKVWETYEKSVKVNKESWKTLKVLAWDLFCRKKFEKVIEMVSGFLKNVTGFSEMQYILARAYQECQDFENARICYSQALSLNPSAFLYWSSAGILYADKGQFSDGFECFSKALGTCQENSTIWNNIGLLYSLCGQKLEADLSFQRAKIYSPSETQPEKFTHPQFNISEPLYSQQFSEVVKKNNSEILSLLDRCITKDIFKIIDSLKAPETQPEEKSEIVIPKVSTRLNNSQNPNPSSPTLPINPMMRLPNAPNRVNMPNANPMISMPNIVNMQNMGHMGNMPGSMGFVGMPAGQIPGASQESPVKTELTPQAAMFQNMMMNPIMFYHMLYRNSLNMARQNAGEKNVPGDDQGAKALLELNEGNIRKKRNREGEAEDPYKKVKEEEEEEN